MGSEIIKHYIEWCESKYPGVRRINHAELYCAAFPMRVAPLIVELIGMIDNAQEEIDTLSLAMKHADIVVLNFHGKSDKDKDPSCN